MIFFFNCIMSYEKIIELLIFAEIVLAERAFKYAVRYWFSLCVL